MNLDDLDKVAWQKGPQNPEGECEDCRWVADDNLIEKVGIVVLEDSRELLGTKPRPFAEVGGCKPVAVEDE